MVLILHSYWAIITSLSLIFAVYNTLIGYYKGKTFVYKDLRIALFVLIFAHLQLLIGLAYYFTSPAYKHLKEIGMSAGMKDAHLRLLTIEHPLMMLLAVILITVGFSKQKKKNNDKSKFKIIAIYYGIALLVILSRIPWDQWFK